MLTVQTRTQSRIIGTTLNKIAGRKRFVQARQKLPCGLWPLIRKGGVLKLPLDCPPRQAPVEKIVSGVKVVFKTSRKYTH